MEERKEIETRISELKSLVIHTINIHKNMKMREKEITEYLSHSLMDLEDIVIALDNAKQSLISLENNLRMIDEMISEIEISTLEIDENLKTINEMIEEVK